MQTPKLKLRVARKALVIALATAAVGALGGTAFAVETASADSANTTIHACVSKLGGFVRVVDNDTTCARTETPLSWNQTGPAGPQGPAGPAGATTTVTATPTDSSSDDQSTGTGADPASSGATITFDQLDGHANAVIAINSASFGLSSGTQASSGSPVFSDLLVSKSVDSFSGALFNAATTGATLGNATLNVPAANKGAALRIQLHDVRITSFGASASSSSTDEQFSLTFDDIFYNGGHYRFPPTGAPSAPTTPSTSAPAPTPSGWNLTEG
jgi:hypothetical protein